MSESEKETNEKETGAPQVGASLRVDPRTLSSEEQEFARLMGFADEGEAEPAKPATKKPAPTPAVRTLEVKASSAALPPPLESLREVASSVAVEVSGPGSEEVETLPETPGLRPRDWEEIHPRAATLGRQSALIERADRVMKLEPTAALHPPMPKSSVRPSPAIAAIDVAALQERLMGREARIAELEAMAHDPSAALEIRDRERTTHLAQPESDKQKDALVLEVDSLLQERDRLGDELATARNARAELQHRVARLEAALRATRGPSGPVPDGERDLRAEVVGLRRRLEESSDEHRRLRETLETQATALAIAAAHRDDRQHENDQLRERIDSFERDRALQIERLDDALARQRELLALVSRVQAENVELRSNQAALEETLEARDLEISAREEHLRVTRRGLALRDEQLIDASERLEQERHRHELLESELDRARLARSELEERLLRREARIASLATTLARIEEAIGRSVPRPSGEIAIAAAMPVEAALETRDESRGSVAPELAPPIALPPVFATWRDEKVSALSGETMTIAGFLARRLVERSADATKAPIRITSLAGARPEAEVELARACTALGLGTLSIRVLEASSTSAEARRQAIQAAGLTGSISIELWGEADRTARPEAHALLLSDALWAQPEADAILDELVRGLRSNGLVLFADRIGGGSVDLSDATLEKLAELWQVLPETWTERPALASAPSAGDDGGAPTRATDLVSSLFTRFEPVTTVGFGHIADLAVGPERGFALSEPGDAVEPFLTSIDAIDESRSILESLPPRHGVAVFACREGEHAGEPAPVEVLGLQWRGPSR